MKYLAWGVAGLIGAPLAALVYQQHRASMMSWHANNLLWYGASCIHFGTADVFDIWADCAIGGCGHGLNEAARKYFAKNLSELSEMQVAALVAAVRGPSLFAPGTELGGRRAREILERATVSHTS